MTKDELLTKTVSAISLGCDKNRCDLEEMLFNLKQYGFKISEDIYNSEIIIVNTCAFISPAVNEAIDNILLALKQKQNKCEKVIVSGCLVERYFSEIGNEFPEVDAFVKIKNNNQIIQTIEDLYKIKPTKYNFENLRLQTTPKHYAYLKIADGCNNGCAYCTIPRIRGRYTSIPKEILIKQAKQLVAGGVRELIIVAQDTTRYGIDLYGQVELIPLLKDLSKIKDLKWIRLHYLYPEMINEELLDFISSNPKICKYVDIPFQHIDQNILYEMNRRSREQDIRDLVKLIHTKYPHITIRTTFIVGFPGETKKQFNKLLEFLKEEKLDNVGFFPFSREEKTKAYFMKKQISNFTKQRRLKKAQKVQEQVVTKLNLEKIGQEYECVIESFDENSGYFLARSKNNSPNVDFYIIIDSDKVELSKYYNVKITDYINGYFKGEIL